MYRTRAKGATHVIETKLTDEQYKKFYEIAQSLDISGYTLFRETLVAALMLPSTPQARRAADHFEAQGYTED